MPAAARLTDMSTGNHDPNCVCDGKTLIGFFVQGSTDVFINGLASERLTDMFTVNCPLCPIGFALQSSETVYVNGLMKHRMTDQCDYVRGVGFTLGGSEDTFTE